MEKAILSVVKHPFINPAEMALKLFQEWSRLCLSLLEMKDCFEKWLKLQELGLKRFIKL